jgi:hypothetical protein
MGNANVVLPPEEDKMAKVIAKLSTQDKVARLFELVDFNGDGTVDWNEVRDRFFDSCRPRVKSP